METTTLAIWILTILDTAILIAVPLLDRRLYRHYTKPAVSRLFGNMTYDDPVNRFLLSKGGVIILSISFIGMLILTKLSHAASF